MRRSEFERFLQKFAPTDVTFDGNAYVLRAKDKTFVVEPPFPPSQDLILPPRATLLQEYLVSKSKIAVLLLHLGEYAAGLFYGTELVLYKTGKHFIRGKTKAGGQSSARYGRIRSQQRSEFLDGVNFTVEVLLADKIRDIDYVFLGGSGPTAKTFIKRCSLLQKYPNKIQKRILPARHANFETLRESIEDVWTFNVDATPQTKPGE